jgi:hypothetical protein
MFEEYEAIKEALIALLCVGDCIRYAHINMNGSLVFRECSVVEIREKEFVVKKPDYPSYLYCIFYFAALEHYEGHLYILEDPQDDRNERLVKIEKLAKTYG